MMYSMPTHARTVQLHVHVCNGKEHTVADVMLADLASKLHESALQLCLGGVNVHVHVAGGNI